jgi:hypothetical protein
MKCGKSQSKQISCNINSSLEYSEPFFRNSHRMLNRRAYNVTSVPKSFVKESDSSTQVSICCFCNKIHKFNYCLCVRLWGRWVWKILPSGILRCGVWKNLQTFRGACHPYHLRWYWRPTDLSEMFIYFHKTAWRHHKTLFWKTLIP